MSGTSVTYALTTALLCHLLVPGTSLDCYKCDSGNFTADQNHTKCVSDLDSTYLRTFTDNRPGNKISVLPIYCTAVSTQIGNFFRVVRDGLYSKNPLNGSVIDTCKSLYNFFGPICGRPDPGERENILRSSNVTFCSTNGCNSAPMIALPTPLCNCTSIEVATLPSSCTSIQKSTGSCNCTSIHQSSSLCNCTAPCNCKGSVAQGLSADTCNPAPVQGLSISMFVVLCGVAVLKSLYTC